MRVLATALLLWVLAACGQTGDLYLPDDPDREKERSEDGSF